MTEKQRKYVGYPTYIRIRCDDQTKQWLNDLAQETYRTPSEWIRDCIFFMKLSSAGALLQARLLEGNIHYRPQRPLEILADDVRFPTIPGRNKQG